MADFFWTILAGLAPYSFGVRVACGTLGGAALGAALGYLVFGIGPEVAAQRITANKADAHPPQTPAQERDSPTDRSSKPQQAPSPKVVPRRYPRQEAEGLTSALRGMHNVLSTSLRDTTTAPSYFRHFRASQQKPSVKRDANELFEHVQGARRASIDVASAIGDILSAANSSDRKTLLETVRIEEPTPSFMHLVDQYSGVLNVIANGQFPDGTDPYQSLYSFNEQLANAIEQQYGERASYLAKIEARLTEIRDNPL